MSQALVLGQELESTQYVVHGPSFQDGLHHPFCRSRTGLRHFLLSCRQVGLAVLR